MALHDFDWFLARLEVARWNSTTPGKRDIHASCPVHGGSDSLHATEKDGKAMITCFACGAGYAKVVEALDAEPATAPTVRRVRRAAPGATGTAAPPRPAYSPAGDFVSRQEGGRWDPPLVPSGIKPSHLHGGLANLAGVALDERIVLAEGHGPAIALNDAGIPAVCTVTGKAGALDNTGAAFLYGRRVVLSPDKGADDHMERCGIAVSRVAAEVLVAPPWPDWMADGDDAAQFIEREGPDAMREHYARATPWTPAADADETFLAEWASEVELVAPEPLLLGFLEPHDYTVLFGDGGTGKGVVAAQWVADLIGLGWVVLLLDYEQNTVMEWAPRVKRFGGDLGRLRVVQATGAIWDHADRVRDEALRASEAHGGAPVYAVVDSVGYAIGDAKLEDSATATKYKKALNGIGLPTLSLAHTSKQSADSARWPFGSIFWHNNVRHTVSITRKGGDEEPRVLANRKANRRGEFAPVEVDWSWVRGELPERLDFHEASAETRDRIMNVLLGGPQTVKGLVGAVNADGGPAVTEEAVKRALNRRDEYVSDGKRPATWSLFGASLIARSRVPIGDAP